MSMNAIAKEWLAARKVIADAAAEAQIPIEPNRFAEAVIARLANNRPPILLEMGSACGGNKTLFEISTGECGEAFIRAYAWAETEEGARALFAAAHPDRRIEDVNEILDSRDEPFVTEISDSGFAERAQRD